ncbi:hypothetical protein AWV79_13490 [Cupriavidus sp. UYMMa02A]|nr:hypothetical protein AWV79_13490 [Cupriavidus sp. UYMMa02A]
MPKLCAGYARRSIDSGRIRSCLAEWHFRRIYRICPIEVAKQLLETRPITLDMASQRVGCADTSTFRQLFKRKTGLSPSAHQRFARTAEDKVHHVRDQIAIRKISMTACETRFV